MAQLQVTNPAIQMPNKRFPQFAPKSRNRAAASAVATRKFGQPQPIGAPSPMGANLPPHPAAPQPMGAPMQQPGAPTGQQMPQNLSNLPNGAPQPQQPMQPGMPLPGQQPPQAQGGPRYRGKGGPVPGNQLGVQAPNSPAGGPAPLPVASQPSTMMDTGMSADSYANPQTQPFGAMPAGSQGSQGVTTGPAYSDARNLQGGTQGPTGVMPTQFNPQDSQGGYGLPNVGNLQQAIQQPMGHSSGLVEPNLGEAPGSNKNSLAQKIVGALIPTAYAAGNNPSPEEYDKQIRQLSEGYKSPGQESALDAAKVAAGSNPLANPIRWGLGAAITGADSAWTHVAHGLSSLWNNMKEFGKTGVAGAGAEAAAKSGVKVTPQTKAGSAVTKAMAKTKKQ